MSKRVYGQIRTANDLKELQTRADEFGLIAVGITPNANVYVMDGELTRPIQNDEIKEILSINDDELSKLIESRGLAVIDDKDALDDPNVSDLKVDESVIEDAAQEVLEVAVPITNIDEPTEDTEIVSVSDDDKTDLLSKIDELTNKNAELEEKNNKVVRLLDELYLLVK